MTKRVWIPAYNSHREGYVDLDLSLADRDRVLLWNGFQQPHMAHWIPLGSGAEFVPLSFIFPVSYVEFFEAL